MMKNRAITYRGVEIEYNQKHYKYKDTWYDFEDVCDLIDVDLLSASLDEFDGLEHLSRSERVRKDLVGEEVVVAWPDGSVYSGVLTDDGNQLWVGSRGVACDDIDTSTVVVSMWDGLSVDQKSLFFDLKGLRNKLVDAQFEVVALEAGVERVFNLIKGI